LNNAAVNKMCILHVQDEGAKASISKWSKTGPVRVSP
jgi:hypothetical protein